MNTNTSEEKQTNKCKVIQCLGLTVTIVQMLASSVEGHRMDVHDCVCKWGKNEAAWAKALCRAKQISYKSLVLAWTSDTADCRPTASALYALYCSFPPSLMLLLYFFLTPCLLFSLFFPFFAHTLSNLSLRFHWLITALFSGAIRPPHYQPCTLFPLYTAPWRKREGRRKELKMSVCMWKKGRGLTKEEEESTGCWGREENCRGG